MFTLETKRQYSQNTGKADGPSCAIPSHKGCRKSTRRFAGVEHGVLRRQISNSDVYLSQLRGISSPHLWLRLGVLCSDYCGSRHPPLVSVILKVRAERDTKMHPAKVMVQPDRVTARAFIAAFVMYTHLSV